MNSELAEIRDQIHELVLGMIKHLELDPESLAELIAMLPEEKRPQAPEQ